MLVILQHYMIKGTRVWGMFLTCSTGRFSSNMCVTCRVIRSTDGYVFFGTACAFSCQKQAFPSCLGTAGEDFFNCFLMCFHLQLRVAVVWVFPGITNSWWSRGISGDAPQNYGIRILGSTGACFPGGRLMDHLFM